MTETTSTPKNLRISGLYGARISFLKAGLQVTDAAVLGSLLLFAILILIFHDRIADPMILLARTGFSTVVYVGSIYLLPLLKNRILYFLVRSGAVQFIIYEFFLICQHLQLIWVHNWQDDALLRWEKAIFGVQPTVWLQRFISPPLTEWLMFSYVLYLFLYPVIGALIYFIRGERPLEDYWLTLILVILATSIGFMVFPIAGPLHHIADAYSVPLRGGFFTAWGEHIRTHIHEIGSNLPSPHCAVGTVVWLMTYRYIRPAFYVLAPAVISLYVSTFYLRFHYLSDTVLGILTGILAIIAAPTFARTWNAAARRRGKTQIDF